MKIHLFTKRPPFHQHPLPKKDDSHCEWNESHLKNEWNHFLMMKKFETKEYYEIFVNRTTFYWPSDVFSFPIWIHICVPHSKEEKNGTEKEPSTFLILENWYANKIGKRWIVTVNDERWTWAWNDFDCYFLIQNKTMLSVVVISKAIIWHLLFVEWSMW